MNLLFSNIFRFMRIACIIALQFLPFGIMEASTHRDSLLLILETELSEVQYYTEYKEIRIRNLQDSLDKCPPEAQHEKYDLTKLLFKEYEVYIFDKAFEYAKQMERIALEMGDKVRIDEAKLELCSLLISGGMFTTAEDMLTGLDANGMTESNRRLLNTIGGRLYYDLSQYSDDTYFMYEYRSEGNIYQKKLLEMGPGEDSVDFAVAEAKYMIYTKKGNYNEAIRILEKICDRLDLSDRKYAIVASFLAFFYQQMNMPEQAMDLYLGAAISDIRNNVKETTATVELASLFYEQGNMDMAHKCITRALEDATFFNARHRKIQISQILPLIETNRMILEQEKRENIRKYAWVITSLVAVLVFAVIVICLQLIRIYKSRKTISEVNSRLRESNCIKDRYIVRFLDLCTSYVDKIERQRKTFGRKLREEKYAELQRMIQKASREAERQDLLMTFDSIFLNLFPTFINDFNELLEEDARIYPKNPELMTTELRIFALIRLGIDDTASISNFLKCSPNTIYTYKTRIRSKTKIPQKKDFDMMVMKIGLDYSQIS